MLLSTFFVLLHTRYNNILKRIMKQIKIALTAILAIIMGTTFTSCLDSDSGPETFSDFVTVNMSLGIPTSLKGDEKSYTYTPSSFEYLKYSDGSYTKRALIYFQLADGEVITEGKTSYNIVITGVYQDLIGSEFCEEDTLTHKPGVPFVSLENYWGANGYLTVQFGANYNSSSTHLGLFNMYVDVEKTEGSTLYVRLNHNEDLSNYSGSTYIYRSFLIPSKSEIEALKEDNPEFNLDYMTNDTVNVKIVALKSAGEELESKSFKIKIPSY